MEKFPDFFMIEIHKIYIQVELGFSFSPKTLLLTFTTFGF